MAKSKHLIISFGNTFLEIQDGQFAQKHFKDTPDNKIPCLFIIYDKQKQDYILNDPDGLMNQLDQYTKITLFAHGSEQTADYVFDANDVDLCGRVGQLHFSKLVKLFSEALQEKKNIFNQMLTDSRLKINLVICQAANQSSNAKAFANQFHAELFKSAILADIAAFKDDVYIDFDGNTHGNKTNQKFLLFFDKNNNQQCVPKREFTTAPEVLNLIDIWLNEIRQQVSKLSNNELSDKINTADNLFEIESILDSFIKANDKTKNNKIIDTFINLYLKVNGKSLEPLKYLHEKLSQLDIDFKMIPYKQIDKRNIYRSFPIILEDQQTPTSVTNKELEAFASGIILRADTNLKEFSRGRSDLNMIKIVSQAQQKGYYEKLIYKPVDRKKLLREYVSVGNGKYFGSNTLDDAKEIPNEALTQAKVQSERPQQIFLKDNSLFMQRKIQAEEKKSEKCKKFFNDIQSSMKPSV